MIDIAIVIIYLIATAWLSISNKRKEENLSSFSKISARLKDNRLIIVATIFASSIGGGTTFGLSEKVFASDLAHSYGLILAIPIDICIAIFILPRLIQHYNSETVGDIMSRYYGNSGRYVGGASAILVSVGMLAAQISVSGRIFEYILQVNYITGILLSYSIVIIYTTIGGFQSILFANQLQFFAIIFTIPIISIIGLYKIGLSNFFNQLPMEKISFADNPDLLQTTIAAAFGFAVINLLPTFIQRSLINRDTQVTQQAIYVKSAIYFIFLIFVSLNGIIAFIYAPEVKANLALSYLIDQIIPVGIQGMVIVGLLSAVMSTADSDLNIISITMVKDFIKPLCNIDNNNKNILNIVRIVNILIGSLAIILALTFSKVVDLVIFIAGFWAPVTLVPLVLGLYNIKISKINYVLCSLTGATAFIIWSCYFETEVSMKAVFVGTLVHLFCFLICLLQQKIFQE